MGKRIELKIYGDVQGVFYRGQICEIAENLGLIGYVKNESDGTVKIIAEGEENVLKKLIEGCYTIPSARIEKIDINWKEAIGEFKKFSIKYDV